MIATDRRSNERETEDINMEGESPKHLWPLKVDAAGVKKFLTINAGVFLLSLGVYFFKFPNNFTTGGVSGLSIILGRFIPNPILSPATMMSIINIFCWQWALFF